MWAKLSGLRAKEQLTTHENMAWIHIPNAQVGPGKGFFCFLCFFAQGRKVSDTTKGLHFSFPKISLWKPHHDLDLMTLSPLP